MFDFFISHCREDKELCASPLVVLLLNYGFDVWFDRAYITVGQEIFNTIESSIQDSRFGVIIVSPNYIIKKWPMHELELFLEREKAEQQVITLPILHNISKDLVYQNIPLLKNRAFEKTDVFRNTLLNTEHICDRLVNSFFQYHKNYTNWSNVTQFIASVQNIYYNSLLFLIQCCNHPIIDIRISIIELYNVIGYVKAIYENNSSIGNKIINIAYAYAKRKHEKALNLGETLLFDELHVCKSAAIIALSELINYNLDYCGD